MDNASSRPTTPDSRRKGNLEAVDASPGAAEEGCNICFDRPRSVRLLPCRHATMCELCTIGWAWDRCSTCRSLAERLIVVPVETVDSAGKRVVRKLKAYGPEEPNGRPFKSQQQFLQAMAERDFFGIRDGRDFFCWNADMKKTAREVAQAARDMILQVWLEGKWKPAFPIDERGHATIPEGETELAPYAFYRCDSLVSVSFPSSMRRIGASAFDHCSLLALTELPTGLQDIGRFAFGHCRSLALRELPAGLESIGAFAFWNCSMLALKELPARIERIDTGAFEGCSSLALTELPVGIAEHGWRFRRAPAIEEACEEEFSRLPELSF